MKKSFAVLGIGQFGFQVAITLTQKGFEVLAIDSDEEIVDRCILGLVNEGAKILEEGVAQRSSDMDIVYINGYGFPIWRGGPMFYANSIGLDKVLEKINKFAEKDEDFWKPADLLVAMANNGGKFADAPTDDLKKEKLAFKQEVKY